MQRDDAAVGDRTLDAGNGTRAVKIVAGVVLARPLQLHQSARVFARDARRLQHDIELGTAAERTAEGDAADLDGGFLEAE